MCPVEVLEDIPSFLQSSTPVYWVAALENDNVGVGGEGGADLGAGWDRKLVREII